MRTLNAWKTSRVGALGLVLGLLLPGGSLPAQSLGDPGATSRLQASVPEVESGFDTAANLSGPEKLERAERLITEMKEVMQRGFTTLGEAKEEKDVIKLTCINQKITAQKGLLKISEQAYIQLQDSVAQADAAAANHEFIKISISAQKMKGLGIETEGCVGEALRYSGKTMVDVETDPDIPAEDPTEVKEVADGVEDHPADATPFR